jgi:hypothetical protein
MLISQSPDNPVEEGDFNRLDSAEHLRFQRVIAPAITTVKRTELFRPMVQSIELLDVPDQDRVLFHIAAKALFDGHVEREELEAVKVPLFEYVHELVARRIQEPGQDVISMMAPRHRRRIARLELATVTLPVTWEEILPAD